MTTSSRKLDHIRICLEKPVDAKKWPFQDLVLLHKALPEIDEADIDTSSVFLGKKLKAPFMISAMTGGHPEVKQINVRLGEAASELGIALGVGSQRAAIEDRKSGGHLLCSQGCRAGHSHHRQHRSRATEKIRAEDHRAAG